MATVVLSIGQCGFDDPRIARVLRDHFNAVTDSARSASHARQLLAEKKYDLVLVNRIFDADGHSGLDFIADLQKQTSPPPVMLISNYADAQTAAVERGALPGFGKDALSDSATIDRLKDILSPATNRDPRTA